MYFLYWYKSQVGELLTDQVNFLNVEPLTSSFSFSFPHPYKMKEV